MSENEVPKPTHTNYLNLLPLAEAVVVYKAGTRRCRSRA